MAKQIEPLQVEPLLSHLGIPHKQVSGQYVIDCPACGKEAHCHVAPDTGLWHCKICSESGNPYNLVCLLTGKEGKDVFDVLKTCGLGTDAPAPASKPKKLQLTKADVREPTDEELAQVCAVKGIDREALLKFATKVHTRQPEILLPAHLPGKLNAACGVLRVRIDGAPCKEGVKYQVVSGSQHGLFGLKWLVEANPDVIVFAEGWADALLAIEAGYYATASSGGASCFKDEWLPLFKGKTVHICMDCDKAGVKAAKRAADRISTVAKEVRIVDLPYEITEDHGKDLKDYLQEYSKDDFLALIKNTPVYEADQKDDNEGKLTDNILSTNRPLLSFPWTDSGAAEMLAELHGDKLRYCYGKGWLYYNGKCWDKRRGEAMARTFCKKSARTLRKEALGAKSAKERKAIEKYAHILEQSHKITATLKEAQHTAPFESYPDDYDSDNWAFNVQNGTVDLRTGKLQPHTPTDLITYCAPVNHDENAKCPLWEKTLLEIFEDNGILVSYLQRCLGMCLTGDVREQILLVFYGIGRNGKNVVVDTHSGMMGDYACEAATTLLTSRSGFDEHPTEIADLCGRRLVIACETQKDGKLKADTVKRLTGNARLKARFMKKDFFEFDRTFKIILCTNHRPEIPENTIAIWERLKVVPFNRVFAEAEQDKLLLNKLKTEWPGILNWMVRGCLDWQKNGLQEPEEVGEATWEYQESQNPLDDFFDQCCKFNAFSVTPVGILKERFAEWNEKMSRDLNISTQTFNEELRKRGCKYETQYYGGQTQKVWCGIDLC